MKNTQSCKKNAQVLTIFSEQINKLCNNKTKSHEKISIMFFKKSKIECMIKIRKPFKIQRKSCETLKTLKNHAKSIKKLNRIRKSHRKL